MVGLFAEWIFVPLFTTLVATFLLFPDGKLPSPRWWPAGLAFAVVTGLGMTGFLIAPRLVRIPAPGGSAVFPNPLGVASLGPVWSDLLIGTLPALTVASLPLLVIAVAALVTRFRAGGPEVRQQVKWLAFALAVMLVVHASRASQGSGAKRRRRRPADHRLRRGIGGCPARRTACHRHAGDTQVPAVPDRVIISKTVKYTLLSAGLIAVYAAIVLGIGTAAGYVGGPVLTVAAAVVIAVLFQPARVRADALANRLVYGRRATPYQVLADFAGHMAGQLDTTPRCTGWPRFSAGPPARAGSGSGCGSVRSCGPRPPGRRGNGREAGKPRRSG